MATVVSNVELPDGWLAYWTEVNGQKKVYFYNTQTETSQWEWPTIEETTKKKFQEGAEGEKGGSLAPTQFGASSALHVSKGITPASITSSTVNSTGRALAGTIDGAAAQEGITDPSTVAQSVSDPPGFHTPSGVYGGVHEAQSLQSGGGAKLCYCLDVRSLQSHFDVSTLEVLARLKAAVFPFHRVDTGGPADLKAKADLYGPFWLSATLTLLLFAFGNAARFAGGHEHEESNYFYLVTGGLLVYLLNIGAPILTYVTLLLTKPRDDSSIILAGPVLSLSQVLSVYGYSLTVALPLTAACVLPIRALKWAFAIQGFVIACLFVIQSLRGELATLNEASKISIAAIFCISYSVLFASFPLYFFAI